MPDLKSFACVYVRVLVRAHTHTLTYLCTLISACIYFRGTWHVCVFVCVQVFRGVCLQGSQQWFKIFSGAVSADVSPSAPLHRYANLASSGCGALDQPPLIILSLALVLLPLLSLLPLPLTRKSRVCVCMRGYKAGVSTEKVKRCRHLSGKWFTTLFF